MLGKKTRAIAVGAALVGFGLVGGATPSSAHPDPLQLTCTIADRPAAITANHDHGGAGAGLYYPVTDPVLGHNTKGGDAFDWSFTGTCVEGFAFESSGTAVGYCGRSVGTGTGSVAGHNYIVHWQSAATQLILTHPSAAGSVNANPLLTTGSCASGTATTFLVSGVVTHTLD